MSSDGFFIVDIRDLVVSAEELPALMAVLKHNKFLHKNYEGGGRGFAGSDYNYSYVTHSEKDNKVIIKPIDDAVWLYLNTFGKETK